jgi:hypothetical protein
MVHLTNEMVHKSPIPNIDTILKTNPDIARQLATAAMQTQSQQRQAPQQYSGGSDPLSGLQNFMSSMIPPQVQRPQTIKSPVKISRPNPQPPQAAVVKEMKPPSIPADISDLLKSVGVEDKKVTLTPAKKGGSTGKNSVSIKL